MQESKKLSKRVLILETLKTFDKIEKLSKVFLFLKKYIINVLY